MGVPGAYRVTRRGSGHPPGNYMGLMGQEWDRPAPKGLVHPMYAEIGEEGMRRREKGRGGIRLAPSFSPPSSFLHQMNMEGGRPSWEAPK